MTHYECLEIERDATADEIKQAYRRLAKVTHPDKVPDQVKRFQAIQQAYEILSDAEKRQIYDESLEMGFGDETSQQRQFSRRRKYCLNANPYALNHYQYTNFLFMVEKSNEEYLTPGQPISKWDKNRLWHQLSEVDNKLDVERRQLERKDQKTPRESERLDLIIRNQAKLGQIRGILTTGEKEKLLYDLSLGPELVEQTEEMLEIERLIGGRERLLNHIKVHPALWTAGSIFALRDVGCLNPVNFDRLAVAGKNFVEFALISSVIMGLFEANLLNQRNFNLALIHKKHAPRIANGMIDLKIANLLNQISFEELLKCGEYAESTGSALRLLQENNLLNAPNRQMVLQLGPKIPVSDGLINIIARQKRLTPEDGLVLQWTANQENLRPLCQRIDEMFAYGIFLSSCDEEKAITVFLLAINLKKSLKTFFEKPVEEQTAQKHQFREEFLQLLHSEDEALAEHRAYWKVIVANVAIALTGIGLFALGAYYLYTRHCFFHQTHRENCRDAIQKSMWPQEELLNGQDNSIMVH